MNQTITDTLINAKSEIFFPSLIFIFVAFLISNILLSVGFFSKKSDWGKIWTVWILTAVIVGLFLIFIVASPEQTLNFINWAKTFWGN